MVCTVICCDVDFLSLWLESGIDGCFVKLTNGAQVLAATGRDGNNNLFPLAFGVVGKEDVASWTWFLTQLKYALGGQCGEYGRWTLMSDRQKVSLTLSYERYKYFAKHSINHLVLMCRAFYMPSKLFSLIVRKGIANAIFTKTFAPLDLGEETLRHTWTLLAMHITNMTLTLQWNN